MTNSLKLDGKPLTLVPLPPTVRRAIAQLDSLPDDELLTREQLVKRLGVHPTTFDGYANSYEALAPYGEFLPGHRRVWGNKRAIASLKKVMAAR